MKPRLRIAIVVASLLAGSVAFAATVYRWVDPDGRVHYSDTPVEGARAIEIPTEPSGIVLPKPAPAPPARESAGAGYTELQIAAPAAGDAPLSNEGMLEVSARLEPPLREGHKLRVSLDGRVLPALQAGTSFTLGDMERGEHTLQLAVVDADGRVLRESAAVNFVLRQASAAAPRGPGIYPPVYTPVYPPQKPPDLYPKPKPLPAPAPGK